ncbi:putative RNA-directed DNA polymerase from transposon X-element [Caerostris extrusa]|uniref:RNA-directed DNA polymerase from transposon X-element n=1 Tax=Caerostris extrusa TaxID=172846 RepID=A0AAV4XNN0_CAEEX|nr:putative RNA-directed DNA polymerase from transposon X-element [Caerostris extrusa]
MKTSYVPSFGLRMQILLDFNNLVTQEILPLEREQPPWHTDKIKTKSGSYAIKSQPTNDITLPVRPSHFIYDKANWQLYAQLADFSEDRIQTSGIDEAVDRITHCILEAAGGVYSKDSWKTPKLNKPWWNEECAKAHKDQKRAWDRLRRYPTSENLLRYQRLKAVAHRIRRRSQRASWKNTSVAFSAKFRLRKCGKKVNRIFGIKSINSIHILNYNGQVVWIRTKYPTQ